MKYINKTYLGLLSSTSLLNNNKDERLPVELRNLERSHPRLRSGIEHCLNPNPVFNYLVNDEYIDDFIEEYSEASKKSIRNSSNSSDETLDAYEDYFGEENKPTIGKMRIKKGFDNGLIDYISGALIKKSNGWFDHREVKVFDADESILEISKYVSKFATILKDYTIRELEDIGKSGVLTSKGKVIAKIEDFEGEKKWVLTENNKTFAENDLIRLLHHSNEPCIIYNSNYSSENFYHSHLSTSEQPEDNIKIRKNLSLQGDAFYSTSSLEEAVRVYGNTYSSESKSKLYVLKDKENINSEDYKFAHLYKVKNNASTYKASLNSTILNAQDFPSFPAMFLLAREAGVNTNLTNNIWLSMKNSSSTLEVYKELNTFNRLIPNNQNTMKRILSSMGYESIEIEIPRKKIEDFKSKIEELNFADDSDFIEHRVNKEKLIEDAKRFVNGLSNSLPAKSLGHHMINFDVKNVSREHITILPKSNEPKFDSKTNIIKEGLYWDDFPITTDVIKEFLEKENKRKLKIK